MLLFYIHTAVVLMSVPLKPALAKLHMVVLGESTLHANVMKCELLLASLCKHLDLSFFSFVAPLWLRYETTSSDDSSSEDSSSSGSEEEDIDEEKEYEGEEYKNEEGRKNREEFQTEGAEDVDKKEEDESSEKKRERWVFCWCSNTYETIPTAVLKYSAMHLDFYVHTRFIQVCVG